MNIDDMNWELENMNYLKQKVENQKIEIDSLEE